MTARLFFLATLVSLIFSTTLKGQEEFISFLNQAELPACFKKLNQTNIFELTEYGKTNSEGFIISAEYDENAGIIKLTTREDCYNTSSLTMKLYRKDTTDYIFLFRDQNLSEESYGNIQVFEKQDSLWQKGRQIVITWEQIFHTEPERIKELKEHDKFPRCMITFKKEGMLIKIPWDLYVYGETNDYNGYAKAGGEHPVLLDYDYFLGPTD
ncbi:MAG: hypothetical protein R3277_08220 [Brumimicrobium sp.]|nr:hypothetical protein [Brumimicrobium sp.]